MPRERRVARFKFEKSPRKGALFCYTQSLMLNKIREIFIHSPFGRVYLWIIAILGSLISALVVFWVIAFFVWVARESWIIHLNLSSFLVQQPWLEWVHLHISNADTIIEAGLVILIVVTLTSVKDFIKGLSYKRARKEVSSGTTPEVIKLPGTSDRKLVLCIDGTDRKSVV